MLEVIFCRIVFNREVVVQVAIDKLEVHILTDMYQGIFVIKLRVDLIDKIL